METLLKQEHPENLSQSDSDREELRSALNRMIEASGAWKRERAQLVAACDQLRRQLKGGEMTAASLEQELAQLTKARDELQQQLKDKDQTAAGWESERAGLAAASDNLRRQVSDAEEGAALALDRQLKTAVDRVKSDLTAENERLRSELQQSTSEASDLIAERNRLKTELEDTAQMLAGTEEAAAIALERQIASAVERVKAQMMAEQERLHQEIREVQAARGQAEESLKELHKEHELTLRETERTGGAATERQMADAAERVRKEMTAARDQLRQELDAAIQLCAQRGSELTQTIAELTKITSERDLANQLLEEAARVKPEPPVEIGKSEERVREEIAAAVAIVRAELEEELSQNRLLLAEAQADCADALAEKDDAERKRSELLNERDQLRERVEELSDVAAQKDVERNRLKEECEWANQMLAEANSARSSVGKHDAGHAVDGEVARVEALMQELSSLIDDPGTELAIVIRKTVERAQLDFYLKGLQFYVTGTRPATN